MPELSKLLAFALLALGMSLTPGPNMIYLISRSLSQGRKAGFISLAGVAAGFLFYLLCAALGITALLMAVPFAYDALRLGGAAYLMYMAWQTLKPGGQSPFQFKTLAKDSPRKLFLMGFLTNLLNPKIAIIFLSLLPQFITPENGHVLAQSLVLGTVQIMSSMLINGLVILTAGSIATILATRPRLQLIQRWVMGTALATLAVRIALDNKR